MHENLTFKFFFVLFAHAIVESSAIPWQEWADTSSQLEAIASLAAHIHITTTEVLIRTYGEAGRHLVSPKLFIECLAITQKVAVQIRKKELVCIYDRAFLSA